MFVHTREKRSVTDMQACVTTPVCAGGKEDSVDISFLLLNLAETANEYWSSEVKVVVSTD